MIIEYGINMTPFGSVLIARSDMGITDLQFTDNSILAEARLLARWQNTHIVRNDKGLFELARKIFIEHKQYPDIKLDMIGSDFQIKVWNELLEIKKGKTSTYGDIAKNIGHHNALRAVGTAVGNNPIQYLIPCHRVIKKDGNIGDYAAGIRIKKAILEFEKGKG